MTSYKTYSEHQLIKIADKVGKTDLELQEEWYRRYAMNFPYKLNIRGEIENVLMDRVIKDEDADKLILEQANRLRERRLN